MADETAKPAGSSGQESRPERMLKSLRDMKEFVFSLTDEEWKALDDTALNRCSRAEFAAFCTKLEAPVSSVTPKHLPSLPGTFGKGTVLPVEGEVRRRWEAEPGAPSNSSQRAPEGNNATRSMIVGMVKKIQTPVQEAIQRVASFQMWMPMKGKTELRQETDADVSSVPEDLRMSPVVEVRSARSTILRRVKDRLVPCTSWSESALETANHCSTSPTKDSHSARPDPAAAKKRKLPAFRFSKKLNKVHPLQKIGEEHQSTSCRNPQEASHGESEASASSFKKLRKRLSRIFRAMTKV